MDAYHVKNLHFDLMKKVLIDLIYMTPQELELRRLKIEKFEDIEKTWPSRAHTLLGMPRLDNIQFCVEDVIANNVPGDLIETGVWRGGACIFMRSILAAYQDTSRTVWVADSFQGVPPPDVDNYPADAGDRLHELPGLTVTKDQVAENFRRYDLLDNQVQFLEGWFKDTLPTAPIERLAVLRMDGDLYESTMDALQALYHKVSIGGYIIVDDYNAIAGCARAVDEFRAAHNITDDLIPVDHHVVYWQKTSGEAPPVPVGQPTTTAHPPVTAPPPAPVTATKPRLQDMTISELFHRAVGKVRHEARKITGTPES